MSNSTWQLHRYGRQWAIWDTRSRAFVLLGYPPAQTRLAPALSGRCSFLLCRRPLRVQRAG